MRYLESSQIPGHVTWQHDASRRVKQIRTQEVILVANGPEPGRYPSHVRNVQMDTASHLEFVREIDGLKELCGDILSKVT